MNELSDQIKTVSNPQQAIEQFVGEQFIEWLMEYIPHAMKSWPALGIIEASHGANPTKVKKMMLQEFLAAEALLGGREGDPGFLRFAIANLSESDDPTAESALEILENKLADELAYAANREHWAFLLHALGASDEEIDKAETKDMTRNYIAELSEVYSNSEWQTAIGAYVAQERAVPEEYRRLVNMIRHNTPATDKDLEILTIHLGPDTKFVLTTGRILDKIVFDPETKQMVWDGVARQLAIRQDFLKGLLKYLN